jgi:hypothetical protein
VSFSKPFGTGPVSRLRVNRSVLKLMQGTTGSLVRLPRLELLAVPDLPPSAVAVPAREVSPPSDPAVPGFFAINRVNNPGFPGAPPVDDEVGA